MTNNAKKVLLKGGHHDGRWVSAPEVGNVLTIEAPAVGGGRQRTTYRRESEGVYVFAGAEAVDLREVA